MKHRILKIGVAFLAVGIIMLAFCFTQTRININAMSAADWSQAHIKGIGVQTEQKIIKAVPVSNVEDLRTVEGIGKEKVKALERHFCTYDTVRFEYFCGALAAGVCLFLIGALLTFYVLLKRKILSEELRKCIIKGK